MTQEPPFDLQPTLVGPAITLRPLRHDDFEALHGAASDPEIWAQHPDSKRYQRSVYGQGRKDSRSADKTIEVLQQGRGLIDVNAIESVTIGIAKCHRESKEVQFRHSKIETAQRDVPEIAKTRIVLYAKDGATAGTICRVPVKAANLKPNVDNGGEIQAAVVIGARGRQRRIQNVVTGERHILLNAVRHKRRGRILWLPTVERLEQPTD